MVVMVMAMVVSKIISKFVARRKFISSPRSLLLLLSDIQDNRGQRIRRTQPQTRRHKRIFSSHWKYLIRLLYFQIWKIDDESSKETIKSREFFIFFCCFFFFPFLDICWIDHYAKKKEKKNKMKRSKGRIRHSHALRAHQRSIQWLECVRALKRQP